MGLFSSVLGAASGTFGLGTALAGAGAFGDYLSGKKDREATENANLQNAALQREFAQNSIQWKVKDAKKAGLHPLYGIGANTVSPSASYVPASAGYSGKAVSAGLQNAVQAGLSQAQMKMLDAQANYYNAKAKSVTAPRSTETATQDYNSQTDLAYITGAKTSTGSKVTGPLEVLPAGRGKDIKIVQPNGEDYYIPAGSVTMDEIEKYGGEGLSLEESARRWLNDKIKKFQAWDYKYNPKYNFLRFLDEQSKK
jgi:hypothetical protein